MNVTLSVFAKPVGGVCGQTRVFPDILQTAAKMLKKTEGSILLDSFVTHAADRMILVMVHQPTAPIESLKDEVFRAAEESGAKKHLFKNPAKVSSCSMTFEERDSEPVILFLAGSEKMPWDEALPHSSNITSEGVLLLARAEGEFPSVSDVCEKFACPFLNAKGICPVSLCDSSVVRTKVIPVVGLGFSLANGNLTGPVDLFDNPAFNAARFLASQIK